MAMVDSLVPSPVGWQVIYSASPSADVAVPITLQPVALGQPSQSWETAMPLLPDGATMGTSPGDHPALAMPTCLLAVPLAEVKVNQQCSLPCQGIPASFTLAVEICVLAGQ